MRQKSQGSRSGLFLIELILSLLVLSLVSTVCIRLFAASWENRKTAREWNHIQELTVNAAEILEAGNGSAEEFAVMFASGGFTTAGAEDALTEELTEDALTGELAENVFADSHVEFYFNSGWQPCTEADASYVLQIQLLHESWSKGMELTFLNSAGDILYQQEIRYPSEGGAAHE